jgi:hypothetical protein
VAWFFVQVWALCLVAFLLGAALTWLTFVRPLRRDRRSERVDWPELPAWPAARSPVETPSPVAPAPRPGPATDPALSTLDGSGGRGPDGPGMAALDALDQIGVAPVIPAQPDPADR